MKFVMVPVEPTAAMVKASNRALREIIMSVPESERKRRWGEPTERGYQISGDEKAAIRYRAMIAAAPSALALEVPGINDDPMAFERRVYLENLRSKP